MPQEKCHADAHLLKYILLKCDTNLHPKIMRNMLCNLVTLNNVYF